LFLKETQEEGYPVPCSLSISDKFSPASDSDSNELRHRDVEQLMKCFDEEDSTELLKVLLNNERVFTLL
jgi:hypothetical protein